jgi:hypothetical protein
MWLPLPVLAFLCLLLCYNISYNGYISIAYTGTWVFRKVRSPDHHHHPTTLETKRYSSDNPTVSLYIPVITDVVTCRIGELTQVVIAHRGAFIRRVPFSKVHFLSLCVYVL